MIFEILAILPLFAGLQFILTVIMPAFVAFLASGIVDTLTYSILSNQKQLIKINGSNFASAIVDSVVFIIIAFGWPVLWWIVLGQVVAKVAGGFVWSILISWPVKK